MSDIEVFKVHADGYATFRCPGCMWPHLIRVGEGDGPRWNWNGSTTKPTLSPSILSTGGPDVPRCHSFIKDGRIEFLSDCSHALAGKTVDLPPLAKDD